jgi:transcription factor TGA
MPSSDQDGGAYFGELEEAFMHQVASLARTQQAATTSIAHHGDIKRMPISLSLLY